MTARYEYQRYLGQEAFLIQYVRPSTCCSFLTVIDIVPRRQTGAYLNASEMDLARLLTHLLPQFSNVARLVIAEVKPGHNTPLSRLSSSLPHPSSNSLALRRCPTVYGLSLERAQGLV